ncbi:MAG TPA: hypothetical protein VK184_04955 [Nostocaceae cyanobacterium]|nr:hypothetical protein [Nostocaceae cyanobacterium]
MKSFQFWYLSLFVWLITLVPFTSLLLFYSYVLRARLVLGRWPLPYQPDPKDLGFVIHHVIIYLSLLAVDFSLFIILIVFVLRSFNLRVRGYNYKVGAALFMITFCLWLILIKFDPGNFWEWFFD